MKEFKLSAWPDQLAATPRRRTSHRRMLNDLSLRFVSLPQLVSSSGASRGEAQSLLRELQGRGLLQVREGQATSRQAGLLAQVLRAIGAWLPRRRLAGARERRRA